MNQRGRWLTNVQGHTGFPDLCLVHPVHRLLWFVELKRRPNKVEPAQEKWLDALTVFANGIWTRACVVWVPEDMDAFIRELINPLGAAA